MFGYYYPRTIYGLIAGFMDMFNNIHVRRYDDDFRPVRSIAVPIKFGPMPKYYMFQKEDESGRREYMQLPTIALTITSTTYASERASGTNEQRDWRLSDNTIVSDFVPTPYDISFQLTLRTESMEDWCQVIEQIIPYFNPSLTMTMREFPMVMLPDVQRDSALTGIERDVKVTLNGVSGPEMIEEQEADTGPRYVNSTLDFTISAVMYKKLRNITLPTINTIGSYVDMPIDNLRNDYVKATEEITIKIL